MIIRELIEEDYKTYKSIRLELLQKHPENFGSSFRDESLFDDSVWKNRISKSTVVTIGAFNNEEIIGICVIVFNPREKMKHISSLHSMYVKEEYRNQNIGLKLIEKAIERSKERTIKRMNLSVVSTNKKAYNLYRKLGFTEYGIEPDTIYYMDKYYSLILMSKEL